MSTAQPVGVTGCDLTIYMDDGGQVSLDVSDTMLQAMLMACGISIHMVRLADGREAYSVVKFDDQTIRENIIPRLPRAR